MKHQNPKQTGKESVYLAYSLQSILKRRQYRKLEAGTEAEGSRKVPFWLASLGSQLLAFVHNPGPPAQG